MSNHTPVSTSAARPAAAGGLVPLEEYLVAEGAITPELLAKAREATGGRREGLVVALERAGAGPELVASLAAYFGHSIMGPEDWPKAAVLPGALSTSFLREHKVLPVRADVDKLVLAIADPAARSAVAAVQLATGMPIELKIGASEEILAAIERLKVETRQEPSIEAEAAAGHSDDDIEHIKDLAVGAPVVRLVNQLLQDAVHARATDLHVEPFRDELKVRLRIDGMLRELRSPPNALARGVVSRIKLLAKLDIAERRLPQDGAARIRVEGRQLDLRVATAPTMWGESVAIRFLDNVRRVLDLAKLGFGPEDETRLREHLAAPHGMIIVTGPTGSGKTTTIASALKILNEPTRKILTIEDPIEYQIEGINQVQAKPDIGLTFAAGLRSFLRHDPDVIMVGEMRDEETADIAVRAALTGHLVLTTLHTNSAAGAVPRLIDMGVDGYLLGSSIRCIIGQRLVRVLCQHCRDPYESRLKLPARMLESLGLAPDGTVRLWRAKGCDRCNGLGYAGRTTIVEVMSVGEELQALMKPGATTRVLLDAAQRIGMTTMVHDGMRKALAGMTTLEEVHRVALDM